MLDQLFDRLNRLSRLHPRLIIANCGIGVWIVSPIDAKAILNDVSSGGAGLSSDAALSVGTRIECTFEVPKHLEWARFVHGLIWNGTVRSCRKGHFGVQFVRSGNVAEVWTKLVYSATEYVVNRNRELDRLNERLLQLSLTDPLTGLYNKRGFQQRLAEEVSRARRTKQPLSLIIFDIDHFKNYNDSNGHPAGDALLALLSSLLRGMPDKGFKSAPFRESDICVRYGGEEFAVLLPDTPLEGAITKADRLRAMVETYPFPECETQPGGSVTISIGVSAYPTHAVDANELVEHADRALYRAKQGGRNRAVVDYEASPGSSVIKFPKR